MTWFTGRLGNYITLKRGYDLPQSRRKSGNVPVVSSSGTTDYHDTLKVKGPGVVTGRYGTLGQVYYILEDFWPLNTSLYVQNFKGNNPRFIAYLLSSLNLGDQKTAGAVPGVNRNFLHEITVSVPDVVEQQKIVEVLGSYDDLLENNQRRIGLLARAARLLYEEWFVRLRFPGHGHVRVVDGVPEGWEKKTLGDVAVLNYGKALKQEDRKDGPYPVYGSSGIVGTHERPLVNGPGIIVGRKGNVGSVYWSHLDFYPIDTVYFVDADNSSYFLYHALQYMQFINNDGAVPGLNRNFAYSRIFLEPISSLHSMFEETVQPIYEQMHKLEIYNQKLQLARDLLLPRLMRGEVRL
jgi:type I restriction enzyme, S subunit